MPDSIGYEKNSEYYKKMARDYRLNNSEKVALKMKLWRGKNKDRIRAYILSGKYRYIKAKCTARRKNMEWNISKPDYANFMRKPCEYCNKTLHLYGIGLDRLDNNKGYVISNVVPCCAACNRIRCDNLTPEEMHVAMNAVNRLRLKNVFKGVSL